MSSSVEVICFDEKCLPKKNHEDDSCFDVRAFQILKHFNARLTDSLNDNAWDCVLYNFGRVLIHTGLQIASIPKGYEIEVRPRSGLALNYGITVLNSPGTVDNGYRGILGVILVNNSNKEFTINKYDRIAQIKITKVEKIDIEIVKDIDETKRGDKGFGSSGVK